MADNKDYRVVAEVTVDDEVLELTGRIPFAPPEGYCIVAELEGEDAVFAEFIVGEASWYSKPGKEKYIYIDGKPSNRDVSSEDMKIAFRANGWKVQVKKDDEDGSE